MPTFLEYNTGNSVYISSTTGRMEYTGTVPPDPTILPDAAVLLQHIDKYAAEIDVDAPWAHPRALEWDSITLGQWIRANAINAAGIENLIRCWTQPGFGADPDELSFLFTLWYVACSGDEHNVGTFSRNSDTANGAQERRFVGGSQLVPLRLARKLGDIVALKAPVERIVQRHRRVHVHTARGRSSRSGSSSPRRRRWCSTSTCSPGSRPTASTCCAHRMGQLMKCDAIYATPFWRSAGLNGFGINDTGAARAVFDNTPPDGGPGVLLAFVGGSTWRTYGLMPKAQRRAGGAGGFRRDVRPAGAQPDRLRRARLDQGALDRGRPDRHPRARLAGPLGPSVRRPHGRVHWAGTETSTYWSGYMDGAVRSGERAAVEVLANCETRSARVRARRARRKGLMRAGLGRRRCAGGRPASPAGQFLRDELACRQRLPAGRATTSSGPSGGRSADAGCSSSARTVPEPRPPDGLSFAVESDVRPLPRCLVTSTSSCARSTSPPPHGDLARLGRPGRDAAQRVLTVRPGAAPRTAAGAGRWSPSGPSRTGRARRAAASRSCGAATPSRSSRCSARARGSSRCTPRRSGQPRLLRLRPFRRVTGCSRSRARPPSWTAASGAEVDASPTCR